MFKGLEFSQCVDGPAVHVSVGKNTPERRIQEANQATAVPNGNGFDLRKRLLASRC